MKTYIIQSLRLTAVMIMLLCVIYPVTVAFIGKFSEGGGSGEKIIVDGKLVGYANIGQTFNKPEYFWGRPSAVGYNAAGSAGSNKGPSNPAYLEEVASRVDTILKYHPYLKKSEIPADLVTASGSGLDPDISPEGAKVQIRRIANNRGLKEDVVTELVEKHIEKPLWGLFGPGKVNVLKLNLALNQLSSQH